MIDSLRPYPEMKQSELLWLGDLPAHWELLRTGRVFREVTLVGFPDLELLSIQSGIGIVKQCGTGRKVRASEDRSSYKRIEPGWLGYNLMNAFFGGIGMSVHEGILSPAYAVAKPRIEIYPRYFHYMYQSPNWLAEFNRESYGIMYERNRLYFDRFRMIRSVVPPLDEQRLIVRFLDWHGAQTANLVRAKKKIIALLNEQKQAIIHRAVTRGLDPNAKLKPSGIPWLGDVPEKWEVKRLRNVAELRVSNVDKKSFESELPVRLCNYVDVYKNDLIHADLPFMQATASTDEIARFRLRMGDVILTKDSEDWKDIGVPALVGTEAEDLVCAYHLALLRPLSGEVTGAFLFWQLLAPTARYQFSIAANGVTRYGLSQGSIKELILAVPSIEEQQAIASHLDIATADLRSAANDANREIALIQEFRIRLIADVVTGKLDVRAAAASLPDTTGPEVIDDLAEDDDLEEPVDGVENEEVAA